MPTPPNSPPPPLLGDREFKDAFGENIQETLDVQNTWDLGPGLERTIRSLHSNVGDGVEGANKAAALLRATSLAELGLTDPGIPELGLYRIRAGELSAVRDGLLFHGDVEAVNGRMVEYRTLPVGIIQFGIAAVSYRGATATFSQRLFHKELSNRPLVATEELTRLLQQILAREADSEDLPSLVRRAIHSYAQRAILTDVCRAEWRMGEGSPCPYELLTGSFQMRLLRSSLQVLRRLIGEHQKFVFVGGPPSDRARLIIGHSLKPGELMILDSLRDRCLQVVEHARYDPESRREATAFAEEYGSQVLMGIFRASALAPPQVFYAHRRHFYVAGAIALADSVLRQERGTPVLLDVADISCQGMFGEEGLFGLVRDAYVRTKGGLEYVGVAAASR